MSDHHVHGDLGDRTPGYDQDFLFPHLDPEDRIIYIGEDKAVVEHHVENPHWSELPPAVQRFKPTNWLDSDNDARSPLEATMDDIKQEDL